MELWRRIVEALGRFGVQLIAEDREQGAGVRWTLPRIQRSSRSKRIGQTPDV
jgi:hypothetical protein